MTPIDDETVERWAREKMAFMPEDSGCISWERLNSEQRACHLASVRGLVDLIEKVHSRIAARQAEPTIHEKIIALGESVPEELIAQLPRDGASELDHYLYGSPKKSDDAAMRAAKRWVWNEVRAHNLAAIIREELAKEQPRYGPERECWEREVHRLTRERDAALQRAETAEKFKRWVHDWLDAYGVPADPAPSHTRETGCRISGRMEWLKVQIDSAEKLSSERLAAVLVAEERTTSSEARYARLCEAVEKHWNRLHCEAMGRPEPFAYGVRGFTPTKHDTAVAALLAAGEEERDG